MSNKVDFQLPEGRWLITIKNSQVKIRNIEKKVVLKEETFLKLRSKINETSKLLDEIKSLI